MKFIVSIYTYEQLQNLKDKLELALLMSRNASLCYRDLNLDKAIAYCEENSITPVLSMDKLYQPSTIESAREFLESYKNRNVLFYITDLGVFHIASKMGIASRVLFDPKTMITNSLDYKMYNQYGMGGLGISSEITVMDMASIIAKNDKNAFIQVFGYRLMFYSKRQLISLYEKKNNALYPHTDVLFKEATRKDYAPGEENENGTVMFRPYVLSLLEQFDKLKDLRYAFLESYGISNETMSKVIDCFKNNDVNTLNSLNLPISLGFIYKDSVYQKEELK